MQEASPAHTNNAASSIAPTNATDLAADAVVWPHGTQ